MNDGISTPGISSVCLERLDHGFKYKRPDLITAGHCICFVLNVLLFFRKLKAADVSLLVCTVHCMFKAFASLSWNLSSLLNLREVFQSKLQDTHKNHYAHQKYTDFGTICFLILLCRTWFWKEQNFKRHLSVMLIVWHQSGSFHGYFFVTQKFGLVPYKLIIDQFDYCRNRRSITVSWFLIASQISCCIINYLYWRQIFYIRFADSINNS